MLRDIEFESSWEKSFPFDVFTELLHPLPEDEVMRVTLELSPREGTSAAELAPVLERAETLRRAGPSGPNEAAKQQP